MMIAKPLTRTEQAAATASELRALVGRLKRRLRQEGGYEGLSLSQLSVLGRLDRHGPSTVTALARAENVRPQSMGATIASLETLGLIAGEPDPNDGRRTWLSLTPMAAEWVQKSRAAREGWLVRTITEHFSAEEQDALARGVALLSRLVEY
ncbi:MarR family transcriptional regulator [Oleiagrimonas sp. C23AA]|uniref:MarR family winged helix-turn-helix transcriptional regulator n=1 Tax=Oleiagrimonas sp. C23AA TaxID=2719047 RepID=UPI001423350C|nr:MarR family transcriptional regulator [Oleiagrimonas sp. C23AA]NII09565.1 MarR family transcriptional regulator [Oleiagrimonas sp. C23AA]